MCGAPFPFRDEVADTNAALGFGRGGGRGGRAGSPGRGCGRRRGCRCRLRPRPPLRVVDDEPVLRHHHCGTPARIGLSVSQLAARAGQREVVTITDPDHLAKIHHGTQRSRFVTSPGVAVDEFCAQLVNLLSTRSPAAVPVCRNAVSRWPRVTRSVWRWPPSGVSPVGADACGYARSGGWCQDGVKDRGEHVRSTLTRSASGTPGVSMPGFRALLTFRGVRSCQILPSSSSRSRCSPSSVLSRRGRTGCEFG